MRVTVLGSGTSHGVPMIGCDCPVCTSSNPRNRRFRPSVCVENEGRVALVDTTPELRMQALAFGLRRVDAVLITHTHADHIFGLDDLRRYNDLSGAEIPVFCDAASLDDIPRIFRYIFTETQTGGGKPRLTLHEAPPRFDLFGMRVETLEVLHGRLPIRAYRFDDFAYVTDVNRVPEATMERLGGLQLLILDAVRYEPHATHFGLYEALAVVERLRPGRALFTHLSHRFDHDATNAALPPHCALAYDGQVIDL
ncbi:MAG: MBL fold metallo-hydrolase [Chthonomonadales bacterium]|nr:MBL fold metallo-hydrolase [Chthonomonadales bacterium]